MEVDAPHALSGFFQQLLQLKKDGGSQEELPSIFQAGALRLLNLKQVHRELCEATEELREATSEAKTQLDQSSLQLQNLLYEQQHYEKEIGSCRAFQSAFPDEQLELVSEEEFKAKFPQMAAVDLHAVMLTRLANELTSREETVRQLETIKAKRDALAADVAQKRSLVSALEAEVAKLRAAAQKVQAQFCIVPPELNETSRMAGMLPQPLYMLWTQLGAAVAALPAETKARVAVALRVGSDDVATLEGLKAMHRSPSAPNAASAALLSPAPPAAAKAGGAAEAFPLSLALSFRKPNSMGPQLEITLRFLPALGLVTATGARPEQDALLASLYPGDDGSQLPQGPLTAAGPLGEVNVQQLPGKPYRWLQHAAGIDILPPLPPAQYMVPGAGQGPDLAGAAAAVQQYVGERRATVSLSRLVEAVLQLKSKPPPSPSPATAT